MMKQLVSKTALIVALAVSATPATAQDTATSGSTQTSSPPLHFEIDQGSSSIWFEGGSTVRGFECKAGSFRSDATIEISGSHVNLPALDNAVADVALEIPVAELDCDNGKMNDHMRKALKAKDHPSIRYQHVANEVVASDDGTPRLQLVGLLTLGGEEREIVMTADAVVTDEDALVIQGSYELDMTEFGIEPPRLMLGTLKVHDSVTVHFNMTLQRR